MGFVHSDNEPYSYFTVEDVIGTEDLTDNGVHTKARFLLSDKYYSHERSVYTFLALIGDFGGFNGAIIVAQGLLIRLYSRLMLKAELT